MYSKVQYRLLSESFDQSPMIWVTAFLLPPSRVDFNLSLDEVSEQLARSLLRARSEFSDEEYTQNRLQALVALAVHSPTIVVGYPFSYSSPFFFF